MIQQANPCLDFDELRLLANGSLAADRMNDAIHHVDGCARCAEVIEELSQSGIVGPLVQLSQDAAFQNELECQMAIGQLVANLGEQDGKVNRDRRIGVVSSNSSTIRQRQRCANCTFVTSNAIHSNRCTYNCTAFIHRVSRIAQLQ